jgi:PAS domain S-box-containing protein
MTPLSHQGRRRIAAEYFVAVAVMVVATLVRWLLDPALGNHLQYITYFVAIVVVATYAGRWPSILAMILGWLAADFFFTAPRGSFTGLAGESEFLVGSTAYFLASIAIVFLGESMHTARRRAEADREALRVTLLSIGDAVIATDLEARVNFMNSVAETLTGWTAREAEGKSLDEVFQIVNEASRKPVENPAARALREGVIVGLANHTVLIAKDGAERPIDDSAAPIRGEQGSLAGTVLVFRDITERKEAERSLRESEARKTAIFEAALDCIITIDHKGCVIEFNAAAERTFGYRRDEVLGRELAELIIPVSLRESHRRGLAHYLATGEGPVLGQRIEMPALRADGSEILVELAIARIGADDPPMFTAYLRDVTQRERDKKARAHLAAIVAWSDDAIISMDLNGVITSWNRGAERLFGYMAEEAVGKPVTMLIPEGRLDEEAKILERIRRGEAVDHYETVRQREDGSRLDVSLTVSPLRDEAGNIVGASKISRDITEQARMRKKLTEQAEQLAGESRRKDEFLAMLSHEIRNPLAPIRSAVHLLRLQERESESAVQQQAREIIERQVANLTKIVSDLLEVSRVISGRIRLDRQVVDLNQVVTHAVQTAMPLVEQRGHKLVINLGGDEGVWVSADATRLEEVFVNLLNNAAKYTDEGGCIEVWCEHPHGHDYAQICIRDNGPGIAPELLSRVFDLFSQADRTLDRAQGGLGVGLSLSFRLVEMHGGTIEAHSPPADRPQERGSEFIVKLPVVPAPEHPPVPASPAETLPVDGVRVLVVDDNIDMVMMLASSLRQRGYSVQSAYNGPDGLKVAQQWRPDVVLLDIGLPGLDGYEVARRIRSASEPELQQARLIALTGYGRDVDKDLAAEAGFDAHMTKPYDFDELVRAMAPKT